MKIRVFVFSTLCFLFFAFSATVVFADYQKYTAILPAYKGDITLIQGSKITGNDYINHTGILIGQPKDQYDSVDVWIERRNADGSSWSRVSDNNAHYEGGGPYTLYSNYDLFSGNTIRVRGQNHHLTYVSVGIIGWIDLQ
ncbi:MAG: hypothetical protein ACOX3F_10565 [Kiritimatiellia bacterium]|jgi:hypothetical protein